MLDAVTTIANGAIALILTKQDDELIECRLSFEVNPELYQRIDSDALFNLKPEVRVAHENLAPSPHNGIGGAIAFLVRLRGLTKNQGFCNLFRVVSLV